MKLRLTLLCFLLSALGYANGRIQITESEARSLFSKSSIVFVLHWNEEAGDYLVEHLKGYPRPENFVPRLVSWRRYAAESPVDPFEPTGDIPPKFIFVFMNVAPESELYVTSRFEPRYSYLPEHLDPATALLILRTEKKTEEETEPNKAMEPIPVNVTIPADAGLAPFTSMAVMRRVKSSV